MELQYDPDGRALLKCTGVLMMVFGIFGILIYLLGLGLVLGVSYITQGMFSASSDLLGMGLLLAGAIVELVAGVLGVKAAKKPARASRALLVWGILTLVLTLAGMGHIALRATTAPWWELALGFLLGVVTPIVYLVGARALLHPLPAEEALEEAEAGSGEAPSED